MINYQIGKVTKTITEQELMEEQGEVSQEEVELIAKDNRRREIFDAIDAIDKNLIMKKELYIERGVLTRELESLNIKL